MLEAPTPTVSRSLWDGAIDLHCFGAATGNWAFKGYDREASESWNPGIGERIDSLLKLPYVNRIYIPSPRSFNAELAWTEKLTVEWKKGMIFRGAEAEGVMLDKIGTACGISSGDCPTIIARNRQTQLCVAAHAGRESLYDAAALFEGKEPRRFPSVVNAIVAALAPMTGDAKELDVFVACGIGQVAFTHPWRHPKHGDKNKFLCRYLVNHWGWDVVDRDGGISLHKVIFNQFADLGVPTWQIAQDGICTFEDMTQAEGYRWHSNRRDRGAKRNFVLTTRRK